MFNLQKTSSEDLGARGRKSCFDMSNVFIYSEQFYVLRLG